MKHTNLPLLCWLVCKGKLMQSGDVAEFTQTGILKYPTCNTTLVESNKSFSV